MTPQSMDTVRSIALSTLKLQKRRLHESTPWHEAGIDSLATLDLVYAVEGHFGITIAPADVAGMCSLRDLAACVDRLTAHEVYAYEA
jgi:acyl carrier protein